MSDFWHYVWQAAQPLLVVGAVWYVIWAGLVRLVMRADVDR